MGQARKILITGGIRNGKSRYVLQRAQQVDGRKVFVATAQPSDASMQARIQRHREERSDDFETVEEPLDLAGVVSRLAPPVRLIIIDCLTVWLGNLFFHLKEDRDLIKKDTDAFVRALACCPVDVMVVTNEVGWGVIPANPLARDYSEDLGSLNQQIAAISDEVIMMVAGLPQWVKGQQP